MPAIPYEYETHISIAIVINYQTTVLHFDDYGRTDSKQDAESYPRLIIQQ